MSSFGRAFHMTEGTRGAERVFKLSEASRGQASRARVATLRDASRARSNSWSVSRLFRVSGKKDKNALILITRVTFRTLQCMVG
jgi:hypothetical protein